MGEVTHKIGVTSRPIQYRIKELKTANPCDLEVIATVESEFAYKIEAALHRRFKTVGIKGEWFEEDIDPVIFLMQANTMHIALRAIAAAQV